MAGYDKQIAYFDYIEQEEKRKNSGFAKLIHQSGQCRFSLNISGLYETDTKKCELCILQPEGEVTLDEIFLQKGRCVYSRLFTAEELREKKIQYETAYGIRIKIADNRYLLTRWKEPEPVMTLTPVLEFPTEVQNPEPEPIQEKEEVEKAQTVPEVQQTNQYNTPEPKGENITSGNEENPDSERILDSEGVLSSERISDSERIHGSERISDDKWEQLRKVYPTVHPFNNEKEYLSIEPKDFIILNREYQPMANNSFLLHGYYNYHHILLGKMGSTTEEQFYLGVPGVFYDREKVVAVMFGFESFESGKEPVETGSFGYYMKKVEI